MTIDCLSMEEIEKLFINNFFIRAKRDRAIYLLNSKKKRRDFFSGLWNSDSRLKKDFIFEFTLSRPENEKKEVLSKLLSYGAEDVCYLLSYITEIDRQFVPLIDGIDICLDSTMGTILICGKNLALVHCERMEGNASLFILCKK